MATPRKWSYTLSLAEPARRRQPPGRAVRTARRPVTPRRIRTDGGARLLDRIGKGIRGASLLASGIAGWLWQTYDAAKTFQAGALFSLLALVLLLRRGGRPP